jgi:hypothetical protein
MAVMHAVIWHRTLVTIAGAEHRPALESKRLQPRKIRNETQRGAVRAFGPRTAKSSDRDCVLPEKLFHEIFIAKK